LNPVPRGTREECPDTEDVDEDIASSQEQLDGGVGALVEAG